MSRILFTWSMIDRSPMDSAILYAWPTSKPRKYPEALVSSAFNRQRASLSHDAVRSLYHWWLGVIPLFISLQSAAWLAARALSPAQ